MDKPTYLLEFEKPLRELSNQLDQLRQQSLENNVDLSKEITAMERKIENTRREIYSNLSPWQKVQLARHPKRPYALDYVQALFQNFQELHGDRQFNDDRALIGGTAMFNEQPVMIIAQQKGRDTKENIQRNFGMPQPEGYRKALRLMKLAEKFRIPVITFIDTPGAYPGVDAEARGQAEAIARAIDCCLDIKVPLLAAVVGEGGSGGAIAIGAANRVLMLEHAIYSVASPEACASILWHAADKARDAAEALKVTAADLHRLGVIDEIVPEPLGGAHRAPEETVRNVGDALARHLDELASQEGNALREQRRRKFLDMGRGL